MKFKFKIQQYQTDAVDDTVAVFNGQPSVDVTTYRRDLGMTKGVQTSTDDSDTGYCNHNIELTSKDILDNIHKIQTRNDIKLSESLFQGLGKCNLDIEMETGTGKTYVYIKTMFELNKHYGWNKFIVVVPSIAIREGVGKSFTMLEDHFMEQYGKKARWFIYNSSYLEQIDQYSSDAGINVMIINTQAFASSMKEGSKNKESRIIYSKRDNFQSRRPIDVIAANRPIIIMDEPQKMEGEATQTALRKFNPLFVLYYSATHKTAHNTIYALDALDAFNKKLVKKIQVKGFDIKNLSGTSSYLYIDNIILSRNKPPMAKIELEVKSASGDTRRRSAVFQKGDDLKSYSNLAEYEGFVISEINPYNNSVTFFNGLNLHKGQVCNDTSEKSMQRVQIRETIVSHFEKERELFYKGIKTLSLFFIDEVSKYKSYDTDGQEVKGLYWQIFEEEYMKVLNENLSLFDKEYQDYLKRFDVTQVHKGYFSIDKKGHEVNSDVKKGSDLSDDVSAYDLILKNKERLLSFDEPTRFIFSHSALREGWDNPNVFQICTLRHANSATAKRQEVGRGLRICVDHNGNRMDYETLGDSVHDINRLTVIANESYSGFVSELQNETREVLRDRPKKINTEYFVGKCVLTENNERHIITNEDATLISAYLITNQYVDKDNVSEKYKSDCQNGTLAPIVFPQIANMAAGIHNLVQAVFDENVVIESMFENGFDKSNTEDNQLNENFDKKEFQELWKNITPKYVYTVHYNSDELIGKVTNNINANLTVTQLKYVMVVGEQTSVDEFGNNKTKTQNLNSVCTSTVKYDVIGEIARGATLTRKTVVKILSGIHDEKLMMFRNNPEEFIKNVIKIIKEEKSTMIVEHISYNRIDDVYDSTIFTNEKHTKSIDKAYSSIKGVMNYVFFDSDKERGFAEDLDAATEVCVYAKLPRSFKIPTPVGDYAPDWAIAFNKGSVKHVFFVAETKGTMDSMELKGVENAKIACAKKLFNESSTSNVKYWNVTTYQDLLEAMDKV